MSNNNNNQKKGLGKGLSALLSSESTDITTREVPSSANKSDNPNSKVVGSVATIPIESIEINPFQPRTEFDELALIELSESIQEHGIIQPITVRKMGYDKYQLISGERRFRASQIAELKEIPAYIRVANDQTMLEMALVENIQREDLNAVEIAISYQRLIEECKLTQEELSKKVGKKRATVTNYLRLLKLPVDIQLGVKNKKISMGHARAISGLDNEEQQLKIYTQVVEQELSVRKVEEIVKKINSPENSEEEQVDAEEAEPTLKSYHKKFQDKFTKKLAANITIKSNSKGAGKITIPFVSKADFERLASLLEE